MVAGVRGRPSLLLHREIIRRKKKKPQGLGTYRPFWPVVGEEGGGGGGTREQREASRGI